MIIQQSIFVIILKASTSIVHPVVRAFTEKLCRPTNRFLQVALYFLLLILIVDWCFELFMRITKECDHQMGKICLVLVAVKLECLLIPFQQLEDY